MVNSKLTLGIVAVVGWGLALWLVTRSAPLPETKIVEVEKQVTVDRIVTRNVQTVQTESRPDGTVIKTESTTREDSTTHAQEQSREKEVAKFTSKTKYSLGVEFGRQVGLDIITKPNIYRVELGYRLFESPMWVTATAGSDKTFLIGIKWEW